MSGFWNKKAETMSRDELTALQLKKLRETVKWAYERNDYYRAKMDKAGVKPADIELPEDIRNLPTINKEDFRETFFN